MITKPTVLVLGAGASIPYGYPSGENLVRDVVLSISNTAWKEIYNACGITDSEMYTFRSELHQSQKLSIDAFLEHRPEFLKAGKVAIALSLLSKESPDAINDFGVRQTGIYHHLYKNLTTSWKELSNNNIVFITFN